MLYEVITPVVVDHEATDVRERRIANDPLAESQWALDAANINGAHEILSRTEPARITSYNVCYTKLLRNQLPS